MPDELNPQEGTVEVSAVDANAGEDLQAYLAERDKKPEADPAKPAAESEPAEKKEEEPGAESDDDAEGEEEEEGKEEKPESEKPRKKGGFQRTIAKLREEKLELQRKLDERNLADQPAETAAADEPKEDDFESFAEYTKALTKWTLAQERKAETEKKAKDEAKAESDKRVAAAREKVAAFQEQHPDYDDALASFPDDIFVHDSVKLAIAESDNPPALLYALSKDHDLARKIAGLSPMSAVKELGKLVASLSTASTPPPKPKTVSAAPKPITSVTGKGGRSVGPSPEEAGEDLQEYRRITGR